MLARCRPLRQSPYPSTPPSLVPVLFCFNRVATPRQEPTPPYSVFRGRHVLSNLDPGRPAYQGGKPHESHKFKQTQVILSKVRVKTRHPSIAEWVKPRWDET